MHPIVAKNAVNPTVVSVCFCKIGSLFLVADHAERCRNITCGHNLQRAVCRMAVCAVDNGLLGKMWLMAPQATGNEPVTIMAVGAEKLGMPAGSSRHLLSHIGMTGKTFLACRFGRVPQRDQGLMGISMALQTVFDLEMRLSCMAKGAGGYRIFPFRRVLGMTVETSDFCGVFTAFSSNCLKFK